MEYPDVFGGYRYCAAGREVIHYLHDCFQNSDNTSLGMLDNA